MDDQAPKISNPSGCVFGGCLIQILGGVLFLALMGSSPVGALFCGFAGVIIGGLIVQNVDRVYSKERDAVANYRREKRETRVSQLRSVFLPQYDALCDALAKPVNAREVSCNREHGEIDSLFSDLECWVNNETLHLLTSSNGLDRILSFDSDKITEDLDIANLIYQKSIPVKNIKFFQREGELYTETKICGGGGGGSSLKGAVVGGVMAGDAGAVIGSRKEVNPISSETIKHDERKVILYFYENTQQTILSQLEFGNKDYNDLMAVLPDKEYHAALSKESAASNIITSPTDQIRELAKLKEDGILTEDEFAEKKKELLSKM